MKDSDLIQALRTILGRATRYNNTYPYNLGYYDGSAISFDCWCMVKALVWSGGTIADNWRVGNFAIYNPATGLGDWDGLGILNACQDVSYDMSNVQAGEYLLLEGNGHAGIYMGDGKVAECTASWGTWKVVCSNMDANGNRSYNGAYESRWYAHGKLPSVEYAEIEPTPSMPVFAEGDKVMVTQGAKVYGSESYFAQWIYEKPMTVYQQINDRVVFTYDGYVQGAVSAWSLIPYEEPKEEEPWHPSDPKPEPTEPIEEPSEPTDPSESEEQSVWVKVIKEIIMAIANAINSIFKKE